MKIIRSKTPISRTEASLEDERDKALEQASKRDKFNKCFKMEQLDGNYEGEMGKNYKKEGNGVMMFDDGLLYIGQFKNDSFHGQALMCLPYGGLFFGNFDKNTIQGPGVMYLHKIRLLVNHWVDSKMDGLCFELHFPSRRWLISQYIGGTFIKYVSEYHLKEEEISEMKDFPQELVKEHDLYLLYTRFLEKNFLFLYRNEEMLTDVSDKNIEIVEYYDDRWFVGICQDGKANGQGVTLKDWRVCTIGTHLGEELNHLVVDYTEPATIFHSFYNLGNHLEPIYYLALDQHKRINTYIHTNVHKRKKEVTFKDLLKFKSDVHKRSPYYYHKVHLNTNMNEYSKLYELDETFYKSFMNQKIPEINSYIYLNLHVPNNARREERPITAFHLENLRQESIVMNSTSKRLEVVDGFIQHPKNLAVRKHTKTKDTMDPPKSREEKIKAVYQPIVNLIRRSMANTQQEIDQYLAMKVSDVKSQQSSHTKIPIFTNLLADRYKQPQRDKARIFEPQRSTSLSPLKR